MEVVIGNCGPRDDLVVVISMLKLLRDKSCWETAQEMLGNDRKGSNYVPVIYADYYPAYFSHADLR